MMIPILQMENGEAKKLVDVIWPRALGFTTALDLAGVRTRGIAGMNSRVEATEYNPKFQTTGQVQNQESKTKPED